MDKYTLHRIAGRFALSLLKQVGQQDFDAIIEQNDVRHSHCHSHDYCDANMNMMEAVEAEGIKMHFGDDTSDEFISACNGAWNIFKKEGHTLLR